MAKEKKRRQHGTGTVFERSDGRWIGRYRDGYTASGGARFRTVSAKTEDQCRAALNKAVRDQRKADTESSIDPKMNVKRWLDLWLPIRKTRVAPKTYTDDASAARRWIVPAIGERRLSDLSPADLRKVDATIRKGKPGKPAPGQATIKRAREVLTAAMKAAVIEGYSIPHRVFLVPPPAKGVSDRAAIPVDQALRILKASEADPYRSRWVAALLNGIRQGEALGLTWDRVDLDHGVIDVAWQQQELVNEHGCSDDPEKPTCGKKRAASCHSPHFRVPDGYEYRQIQGRWHWVRPKTKSGTRLVPLVPWLVAALREWRMVAPYSPHGLVWPAPDGGVREKGDDLRAFHDLQAVAGVAHPSGRPYHGHEMRHATASILLALKVDTQIIVALMGHSSILSSRTYMHHDQQQLRDALDGVAERLQLTT